MLLPRESGCLACNRSVTVAAQYVVFCGYSNTAAPAATECSTFQRTEFGMTLRFTTKAEKGPYSPTPSPTEREGPPLSGSSTLSGWNVYV
jgi:hypothetical protein